MLHFSIASFIGLASGFGANVLMRLARRRPRLVEAVILFNADSAAAGWLEWGRGLVHAKSLAPAAAKGLGLPPAVAEWLVGDNENDREISLPPLLQVWHHLGGASAGRCPRLAESYRQHFLHHSHPANLLKLIQVRSHSTGEPPVATCCHLLPPLPHCCHIQCYNGRDTVKLARDIASNGRTILGANRTLKMPCLNMVGEFSPHVDLTVDFNG